MEALEYVSSGSRFQTISPASRQLTKMTEPFSEKSDLFQDKSLGSLLFKIQEDIQQIQSAIERNGINSDDKRSIFSLQQLLKRTKKTVNVASQEYANILNSQVQCLPFAASNTDLEDVSPQLPASATTEMHRYTNQMPQPLPADYSPSLSPGQMAKMKFKSRVVNQPENLGNREVLNNRYNLQKADSRATKDKRDSESNKGTVIKGKTVQPLGPIPRANRMDPQATLPAIEAKDQNAGLLNMIERGLVPYGSHVALEPLPVENRKVKLHQFSKAKCRPIPIQDMAFNVANVKLDLSPQHRLYEDLKVPPSTAKDAKSATSASVTRSKSANNNNDGVTRPPRSGSEPMNPPATPASASTLSSGHRHRLAVQNGEVRENDDLERLKNRYGLFWSSICLVLPELERFCQDYSLPLVLFDGGALADFAMAKYNIGGETTINAQPLKLAEIMSLVANKEAISALMKEPGRAFSGPNGLDKAVVVIQKWWRRFVCRRKYLKYRDLKYSAGMIALQWIMRVRMSKIKKLLHETRMDHLEHTKRRNKLLARDWGRIKQCRRVEIHIPSLGLPQRIRDHVGVSRLGIEQNLQIGRLCRVSDEKVDVVYVTSIPVSEDRGLYYRNLLSLNSSLGVEGEEAEINDISQRYSIIHPESLRSFPSHCMSLASVMKYSPKSLKRIRSLIHGRDAYIVPGVMTKDDLYVADALGVPILGPEPEIQQVYSTKCGAKRIFDEAEVPVPPYHAEIYNLNQLHDSLAQLIVENVSDIRKWLFKIDDQEASRGIGIFDATKLPCFPLMLKEAKRYGDKWTKKWAQEPSYHRVLNEIPEVLASYGETLTVLNPMYANWNEFIKDFLAHDKSEITISSLGDQLHPCNKPFECIGYSMPQSSVEADILNKMCFRIGDSCRRRKIVGYVNIDFVTFIHPTTMQQEVWVTDLKVRYCESTALGDMVSFITRCKLDSSNHLLCVPETNEVRYAAVSSRLFHTNLQMIHYNVFFEMCRAHGIGYDLKEKQGTIFGLVEDKRRQCIQMLTVSDDVKAALVGFARNLNVIHQEISTPKMQGQSNFQGAINEIEKVLDISI